MFGDSTDPDDEKTPAEMLKEAGFTLWPELTDKVSVFGTIAAEPYDVGKNHFEPRSRYVHVSGPMQAHGTFYYVTSSIRGRWRGYRKHTWVEDTEVGNIFASGPTQHAAVKQFIANYKARTYNRTKY